jgi:chromate reductase, NAD(P)H dehydrogenase (quinone)
MLVLGLSGSLRADSHNSRLLHHAGELLPPEARLVQFSDLKAIPPYDADDDAGRERPGPVLHLAEAIRAADAVLVATPEYNHSMPGQLKNALDWISRPRAESPFIDKPAAVIGASTGMFGAVWAQAEARKVLAAIGARVLDRELPVPSADETLAGDLDPELERELASLVTELVEAATPATLAA